MRKIIIAIALLATVAACKKTTTDPNVNKVFGYFEKGTYYNIEKEVYFEGTDSARLYPGDTLNSPSNAQWMKIMFEDTNVYMATIGTFGSHVTRNPVYVSATITSTQITLFNYNTVWYMHSGNAVDLTYSNMILSTTDGRYKIYIKSP